MISTCRSCIILVPSPQSITNWVAFPTAVIVNVAVNPPPPAVTSLTKLTLFTKVLLRMFSVTSLGSSIASVTLVVVSNNFEAPAVVKLLSVIPSVIAFDC